MSTSIRPRALAIVAAFSGGLSLGCADRQAEQDDEFEPELMAACVTVWGDGYWDDGSSEPLINERDTTSTVCMCMTWDEQQDIRFGEMELFSEHEINTLAFDECKRVSALHAFDTDDCQVNYETGDWRPSLGFAIDEWSYRNQQGLSCDEGDPGDEVGCAFGGRPPPAAWLIVFAGLFGLRRRRDVSGSRNARRA